MLKSVCLFVAFFITAIAQTTISDTILSPFGGNWAGRIRITCPRTTSNTGGTVATDTYVTSVSNGALSITIRPYDTASPSSTCTARYEGSSAVWSESWMIPTSGGTVKVSDILRPAPSSGTVAYVPAPPLCPATPPVAGAYRNQCLGTNKLVYTCANSAGCSQVSDWGAGATLPQVTNLIAGDGNGGASDSGLSVGSVNAKMDDPMTTRGDLIYRGSGGTTRLALGSNGYCLTSDGTDAVWAACPSGGANSSGYYLVNQSTNAPTNAVNLGALTTGLVKLTVSAGVATPSTASGGDIATTVNGATCSLGSTCTVADSTRTLASVVPSTAPTAGQILVGNAGGTAYAPVSMGTDCSLASTGAITCTKTNNVSFGSAATMNLSNVTNDVQTKAAIVPNTAPTAGQLLVGNVGGTAYAPVALSGDCTSDYAGVITCTKTGGVAFGTGATATIANYAPLASPAFTGFPAAPTAAADTNNTQIATTAYVLGQASSSTPSMNGSASAGTSTRLSRYDHVHPTDTSRVATSTTVNAQALSGNISVNNGAAQYSVAVNGAAGAVIQGVACGAGTTLQGAASANPTCTATPTLGVAGTTVGSVALANATSGSITLSPTTGALATTTITLPANTGTAVVAATSTTATQAMFATATAGAPAFRAIAAGDLPSTLTSGTAITNASLTTPTIGVATATSVNKVAITAPATSATLTIANGKTLTANNSITLAGTDSTTMTFPSASATISQTIASGTASLGTSSISSVSCATVVTVSATGTATTDVIEFTPNADITAVTGYAPSTSGGLSIYPYPTTNNVNFKVCNWSGSSITPGAVTLNWRVAR